MNFEDGLNIAYEAVLLKTGKRLSEVEISVLRGSWQQKTYDAIADETHYSVNYLKIHVGPALWKTLSTALGEPITKNNVRSFLERRWQISDQGQTRGEPQAEGEIIASEPIATPLHLSPLSSTACQIDWGEVVDVSKFYGRTTELSALKQWITVEQSRLVVILGMGGIGKTALSAKLAHQLTEPDPSTAFHSDCASSTQHANFNPQPFQFAIWRSLRNSPPLVTLMVDLFSFLS
ncbi:MAG: ATP-binding protein, partial [Thermosynechococcaceae cyanobacterium]